MRKLGRKLTSALLTLALLVSVLPIGAAPAQAADTAGAFEVTGGTSGTDYSYSNGVLTVNDGASITISMASEATKSTSDRIVVNGNAKITLNGVNITPVDAGTDDGYSGIDLASGATLNITLSDDSTNEINGGTSTTGLPGPGIHLPAGSTLTINGSGSLEVHGASGNTKGSVGIGGMGSSGYAGGACGNVLILGGTIKVHGGTPTYSMGKQPVDIGGGESDMQKGGDCNTVIILTPVNSGGGLTIGGGAGSSTGGGNGSDGQGIRPASGQENTYTVWGNLTLPCDITIPQGGTFTNNGTLDGNPLGYPSTVTVAISGNGVTTENMVAYGTTATVTATVTGNNQPASDGTVTFYRGEASDENKINETPAKVSNGKGIKIELDGVVSGENVSASSESISYDDGNVGIGKTITASDIKLNGDDAGNYTLGTNTTITTDAGVIIAAEITGSVTISGTPTVGETLKATYSGGNATEISYQWYRGDTPITDATGTSYTLTAADAGKSLSVRVTASGNYSGSVESESVTVQKTEQSAPETGTGYKIDYVAETISAENGYELAATKGANDGSHRFLSRLAQMCTFALQRQRPPMLLTGPSWTFQRAQQRQRTFPAARSRSAALTPAWNTAPSAAQAGHAAPAPASQISAMATTKCASQRQRAHSPAKLCRCMCRHTPANTATRSRRTSVTTAPSASTATPPKGNA